MRALDRSAIAPIVLAVTLLTATSEAQTGPDLVVGDISSVAALGHANGITAYSLGIVACNRGDQAVGWAASTNQHPVLAMNLYRLRDGRFEHIGMSWAHHEFFALATNFCFGDCDGQFGDRLGVHCASPQSASSNGAQPSLGPRSQVDASTGAFPYPPTSSPAPPAIGRRLQVHDADLDPAQNVGALYFVEAQYVASDDALAGTGANNASHRAVAVGPGPNYPLTVTDVTRAEEPAIRAWRRVQPEVLLVEVDVPGDGRFLVGSLATDQGGGLYQYEYAVQNLTSDRSARSFSIPIPASVTVGAIRFHDVDTHSGEPYATTDWTAVTGGGAVDWSTETEAQNPNANALRWGTLYTFGFDASGPPAAREATIGLFKAGAPAAVSAPCIGPCIDPASPCLAGTVGSAVGPAIPVLRVNGSAGAFCSRVVSVAPGQPITMSLDGPLSSGSFRYSLWAWTGESSSPRDLVVLGQAIGCTINPTPLEPGLAPQPIRCLRGGFPRRSCGEVPETAGAPARAPWTVTLGRGLPSGASFLVQGIEEDPTASNSLGVSVTNALVLRVE